MSISEKTVELNFTSEIVRYYEWVLGAPVSVWAPTQQQEARLGYDGHYSNLLGISFYVQFKSAGWHPAAQEWRFKINHTAAEDQHQRLLALSARRPTWYVLPLFDDYATITGNVGSCALLDSPLSVWLAPGDIPVPPPGVGRHMLGVKAQPPHQLTLYSDPQTFKAETRFKPTVERIIRNHDPQGDRLLAAVQRTFFGSRPPEGPSRSRGSVGDGGTGGFDQPPETTGGDGDDDGGGTGLVGFSLI